MPAGFWGLGLGGLGLMFSGSGVNIGIGAERWSVGIHKVLTLPGVIPRHESMCCGILDRHFGP